MAAIVKANTPRLKEAGFRKRRYGFTRSTTDGLVHVVHFWMAPFEPPAWTEVPGLRERRYGGFRLDFGVFVPAMTRTGSPLSPWINEYNCHLRRTVGQLFEPNRSDYWWDLHDQGAAVAAQTALHDLGLPWLDRFPSTAAVLEAFEELGPLPLGMTPAGGLDIADLYESLDRREDARRTLAHYVATPVLANHADYLSGYLTERGRADLVPLIRTGR